MFECSFNSLIKLDDGLEPKVLLGPLTTVVVMCSSQSYSYRREGGSDGR